MTGRFFRIGYWGLLMLGVACMFMVGQKITPNEPKAGWAILEVFAQQVRPTLAASTIIKEEHIYLCGDIEEVGRKNIAMTGMATEKELKDYYLSRGFKLEVQGDQVIVQKKVNEFCSYHRNFRHLGQYRDKLAIYQGPLGYQQKLIKIEENFPLNKLSEDFQVKLQQSMDFWDMTPETQAKLRYELEYASEDALNAVLENLDELQE